MGRYELRVDLDVYYSVYWVLPSMSRSATYKFLLSQKKNDNNQSVHRALWLESYAAAAPLDLCSEALETLTDFT